MNILVKNPALPQKAWKTNLHFLEKKEFEWKGGKELPFREREDIYLPINKSAEFHSLKLGTQFLFAVHEQENSWRKAVYFGGTDEEPFLVRLNDSVLKEYEDGGEDEFFQALKPPQIKILEKIAHKEAKRQGDFFFISIPNFSWKILMISETIHNGKDGSVKMQECNKAVVFNTRHTLTGLGFRTKSFSSMGEIVFIEGTLQAPDHEDQILKGPHAIIQAVNLFDPKNAD